MTTDRQKIADAVMLLLAHGFTISRNGATKSPTVQTAPVAPPPALTADGRAAYTCGQCGAPGHNVRACPQKTQAAKPAAAPKAPAVPASRPAPVATPAPSISLDSLDFDLGDMGGAPTPAPKAAAPKAPKAQPAAAPAPARKAAPAPAPTPEPEATEGEADDAELSSFLDDLDALLPGG